MKTIKRIISASERTFDSSQSYSYKSDSRIACKQSPFRIQNSVLVKSGCNQPAKINISIIEVDWNGIKEQSEQIQKYFQEGGKSEELSGIKFIKPFAL